MLCNRLYVCSIFPTCLYDVCFSVQLGNFCSEPWPPCNSGMWWIHIPMYRWYMTSVKKEVHWWLAYPEVFLHHLLWAGGWQTPKYTGTLPFVTWVMVKNHSRDLLCVGHSCEWFTGEKSLMEPTLCLPWIWIFQIPSNHSRTMCWHSSTVSAHFHHSESVLTEGRNKHDVTYIIIWREWREMC